MNHQKIVETLSRQRHDYANHLQVIKGYLELGLPERALEYVDAATRELAEESRLFKSVPPVLALALYELQLWTRDRGISLRMGEVGVADAVDLMLSVGMTSLRQLLEKLEVSVEKRNLRFAWIWWKVWTRLIFDSDGLMNRSK